MKKILDNKHYILLIISLIFIYTILLLLSRDLDQYFEIASGRDILSGNFYYSTALNRPVVIQQWLYSVIMVFFDGFGYIGNITLVFIQNTILWYVSYIFIYRKTNSNKKAILYPLLAMVLCAQYMINIRPQIITMIIIIIQFIILDIYKETNNKKYLFIMFPLLILAANFHQAVFLYHIFILAPYYVISIRNKKLDWTLIWFTPFYILCSLLTPYGINGFTYIYKALSSDTFDLVNIIEIRPLSYKNIMFTISVICIAYTIYLIYLHKSNIQLNFFVFSIFLLSLTSARHMSLLYIPVILVLIEYKNNTKLNTYLVYLLSLMFFICVWAIGMRFDQRINRINLDINTNLMEKDAKIFNYMDYGGFLEYNGYTNIALDTRPELYSKEELNNQNALIYGFIYEDDTQKMVDDNYIYDIAYEYDYIILKPISYANRILDNKFDKIYESKDTIIWKNNNILGE